MFTFKKFPLPAGNMHMMKPYKLLTIYMVLPGDRDQGSQKKKRKNKGA